MLISIEQWLALTGIFYGHAYAFICKLIKLNVNNIDFCILFFLPIILFLLLLLHGDIEYNPGPWSLRKMSRFNFCYVTEMWIV